jgi:hypothetical protein
MKKFLVLSLLMLGFSGLSYGRSNRGHSGDGQGHNGKNRNNDQAIPMPEPSVWLEFPLIMSVGGLGLWYWSRKSRFEKPMR